MICISIGDRGLIEHVNRIKPDLVELRFDLIGRPPGELITEIDPAIRIIATCRPDNKEINQEEILRLALQSGVAYADLEIEMKADLRGALVREAHGAGTEVIISWHDFTGTPLLSQLKNMLQRCYDAGADVAKLATLANSPADAANLLSLYAEPGRKVVIGMGVHGKITRYSAINLGAAFTFASLGGEYSTAPGQPKYDELIAFNQLLEEK